MSIIGTRCESCGSRGIIHEPECHRPGAIKRRKKPRITLHYQPIIGGRNWWAEVVGLDWTPHFRTFSRESSGETIEALGQYSGWHK